MGYIVKKSSSQAKFVELSSYTEESLAENSLKDANKLKLDFETKSKEFGQ